MMQTTDEEAVDLSSETRITKPARVIIDSITVGKLFTTNGTDVWRQVTFCEEPTASFINLETREQMHGAVGCKNFENLRRLKQEYLEKDTVMR